MTGQHDQQMAHRVVSVGAAPGAVPLLERLLATLGSGYRAETFDRADIILLPATTAVTVEGAAGIAQLRRSRPALGIVAVTTGAPISPADAVTALDAGADAVVRVQTPSELSAHIQSVARRLSPAATAGAAAAAATAGIAAAASRPARGSASRAAASQPRRRAGRRTRVAAAVVSGGTALGLAGVMAAHAAANSRSTSTVATNAGSSGADSGVQPASPQGSDDDSTGFFGGQPTTPDTTPSTGTGSGDSSVIGSSGSAGRFGGGTANGIPVRPHTRTHGS